MCASSLICIRQKHKIADKIASVNQALAALQSSFGGLGINRKI
jgi:hypothetical protein